jgi:hypothetical protein
LDLNCRVWRRWTWTGPESRGQLIMTSARRGIGTSRALARTRAVIRRQP